MGVTDMEYNDAVLEENTQEVSGKKALTNENKVSIFLFAISAILWIFVPFFKGDAFRIRAVEMLTGPVFKSWDSFTEAFYGKLTYSEYMALMSLSREFWVAIAVGAFILLGMISCFRSNRRFAFLCAIFGILAFLAPMLEIAYYMLTAGVSIPAGVLLECLSGFDWGYWAGVAVFVAIGIVNREKRKSE